MTFTHLINCGGIGLPPSTIHGFIHSWECKPRCYSRIPLTDSIVYFSETSLGAYTCFCQVLHLAFHLDLKLQVGIFDASVLPWEPDNLECFWLKICIASTIFGVAAPHLHLVCLQNSIAIQIVPNDVQSWLSSPAALHCLSNAAHQGILNLHFFAISLQEKKNSICILDPSLLLEIGEAYEVILWMVIINIIENKLMSIPYLLFYSLSQLTWHVHI